MFEEEKSIVTLSDRVLELLEMYKQGLLRERLTDEKGNPFI